MGDAQQPGPEKRTGGFLVLPVLHRYVLTDLVGTFAMAFFLVMALMFVVISLEVSRRAGVDVSAILTLAPHALPFGFLYALPVALLLAVTFTFSRMAADNEITALRAAGSSLWPVAAPVLLLGLLLTGAQLGVTLIWLPRAHMAKRRIVKEAGLALLSNLPAGEQDLEFGDVGIHYGDVQGNVLKDVIITEVDESRLSLRITAREGRWAFDARTNRLRLELIQSQWTWFGKRQGREQKFYPGSMLFALDLNQLYAGRPRRVSDYRYCELLGLREVLRDIPERLPPLFRWKPVELEYEIHKRFSLAFSPLIVALLGMPLGIRVRQRGKLAAFFAGFIPVVVLYYPLVFIGEGLATQGSAPPAAAAWMADVIVGGLGGFLTLRAVFR